MPSVACGPSGADCRSMVLSSEGALASRAPPVLRAHRLRRSPGRQSRAPGSLPSPGPRGARQGGRGAARPRRRPDPRTGARGDPGPLERRRGQGGLGGAREAREARPPRTLRRRGLRSRQRVLRSPDAREDGGRLLRDLRARGSAPAPRGSRHGAALPRRRERLRAAAGPRRPACAAGSSGPSSRRGARPACCARSHARRWQGRGGPLERPRNGVGPSRRQRRTCRRSSRRRRPRMSSARPAHRRSRRGRCRIRRRRPPQCGPRSGPPGCCRRRRRGLRRARRPPPRKGTPIR